ncbi:MAG: GYD domain-containing protein [Acidiferrobacterales bacterium]
MATFISLVSFTEQGIRNIKQSPQRAQAFKDAAQKAGVTVKDIYWTLGSHDIVVTIDAPNEEIVMSLLLGVGSLGNIRTQTLRAFSAEEIEGIISKIQ